MNAWKKLPLKLAISAIALGALVMPSRTEAQENPDSSLHQELTSFQKILRTRDQEQRFIQEHGVAWGKLWDPEYTYIRPEEYTEFSHESPPIEPTIASIFQQESARNTQMTWPFSLDLTGRAPVDAFVQFWSSKGRSTLSRALARMGVYGDTIQRILEEEGAPQDLIYLCLIESAFSPRALSPANARGLWQFIPSTASVYGLRINAEVDERLDPVKSTRAAARYLKDLRKQTGSWLLAMAGYNAGGGHVLQAISRGKSNSYWELSRRGTLYRGARNYVAKILAAALIGRNREHFGMHSVVPNQPWSFDTVHVPPGTALAEIARASQCNVQDIRSLNPELLGGRTPGHALPTYALRIPKGKASSFAAHFNPESAQNTPTETLSYTTRVGESLQDVATRLGIDPQAIRHHTGLSSSERLPYRSTLEIPLSALQKYKPTPNHEEDLRALMARRGSPGENAPVALLPPTRFHYPNHQRLFYEVKEGDDLELLSRHTGIPLPMLAMWNGMELDAPLPRKAVLQLYVPADTDLSHVVLLEKDEVRCVHEDDKEFNAEFTRQKARGPAGTGSGGGKTYRVKNGETLHSIARRFRISVKELKRWNNIKGKRVKPGYRLIIRGAAAKKIGSNPRGSGRGPVRASNVRYRRH